VDVLVLAVAPGAAIDGTKMPSAIEEGSTENATLLTSLIVGLPQADPWRHPPSATDDFQGRSRYLVGGGLGRKA
jgi:hypothetical protein